MPFRHESRTVLVVVDMVVDSVTGFWPVHNPDELVANVRRVRDACHAAGIPVVQLQHTVRADGLNAMLNEARDGEGRPAACVEGTPGWRIVPELAGDDRDVVLRKSRWHGFFGTELLSVLRALGAEQLVWAGGFTECCLGLTVFEGYFHDYPSALVVDAASSTTPFTHKTGVLTMANWISDLSIFTTAGFTAWAAGDDPPRWYAGRHNTVPFGGEADVERHYRSIVAAASCPPAARTGAV